MASSGNSGGAAARKHLRVLLPFSCDSLRIPEELAGEIGDGEARIVGPSGGKLKVRGVEVARDGGGAFLRRGWPEFADACGVSPGCSLVLRHHGGGVLTVKVFDASCCLRELGSPPPAGEATASSKDAPRKPQFICMLSPDSMEKMLVPAKFVQHCIPKEHLNNRAAATFGLLGKISQVELEMNQSGVFFTSGWSQFLAFHSITEVNALLLRYESNMVFTVKMFESDGCQRGSKHNDIAMQQSKQDVEELQEAPVASNLKRCKIELPSSEGEKIPEGSKNPLNKTSLQRNSVYKIGPPAWIQKHMNASTLKRDLRSQSSSSRLQPAPGGHSASLVTAVHRLRQPMLPAMASCGNRGGAGRKHLRVLLPFTHDSLRIPDELAAEIDAEEAFVVAPFGKGRVRPVEVGEDGDGAFLGRGWPEFAAACGAGAGWHLVLRHHGAGVLTVKAFDASHCLREFATRPPAAQEPMSSTDASRRPQFISMLAPDSMEKLPIPAKFVQSYTSKGHVDNRVAILFGPLGKICQVELKMNGPDTFFSDGWSQFLALHGITEANCLLLRHEGNGTFTVKVFGANGFQIEYKQNGIKTQQISTLPYFERQQELLSASSSKGKIDQLRSEEQEKPKASATSLNNDPFWRRSFYDIGPPSWIKKVMNTNTLKCRLNLAKDFCNAIGLPEHCMITLKTSTDSTKSWHLHCAFYNNTSSYRLTRGWKKFCEENSLKEGDVCTFNVSETTLWNVVIMRCKEKIDQFCNGTPSASSRKRKSKNDPIASLNKASSRKLCTFEIGPPAWLKKDINTSTIENVFSLPRTFCQAIGLREEPCTITLKTSMSSATSWQARVAPQRTCNHLGGLGWKRFCQENRIKEGDICTFNVVDTKLWHVVIAHQ
ncbi:unnamed protein product [Urochloa decumbens]|uniref:TF-B3 domain-containing protein n=1 Tax=Urochloa decumbens TaxID=240449 RepID=A0ABC9DA99_9POAL